jgi:hypothetical protein
MTPFEKIRIDVLAWWWVLALLLVLTISYGKQSIEWILVKLYQFFVQKSRW